MNETRPRERSVSELTNRSPVVIILSRRYDGRRARVIRRTEGLGGSVG